MSHIRIVSDSIAMSVPLEGGRRLQRVSEAETVSVRMRKINRSCPTVLARLSCCEHRSLGFQSRTWVSENTRRRRLETFLRFTVLSNFHRLRHPNRFREILCKTSRERCELDTTDNMKRPNSTHVTMEIFSPMKSEKEVRSKFQIRTRDANEWRICRSNRSVDRERNSSGYV